MTAPADPLDAMAASPEHHTVLLENDKVRILDTCLRPGERTAVHAHEWPAALYVISWSDFRRFDPHGAVLLDSRDLPGAPAPGQALWAEALIAHCVENVGQNDLRIIAVEVKPAT